MPFRALSDFGPDTLTEAATLAALLRPHVEACIAAFGPQRAMFKNHFPVDYWSVDYRSLQNAFKLIARGASADEKRELFAGTTARFLRRAETIERGGRDTPPRPDPYFGMPLMPLALRSASPSRR